ncbi:regulatory subunit of alpha,alpha-trehalose-phosphate synthase [Scheffersomyces coipomensis]|uniref:regulatory subunit of alpha,alpha-trehalose-phosphate synthase n=1 Tax=Scheffersomyces coipomensis TaxID=1788519 RepID=UPI00315D8303
MTVIIASLFLPYTVQFEIGPQTEIVGDAAKEINICRTGETKKEESPIPVSITPRSSILPSLSKVGSLQHSPISNSPRHHEVAPAIKESSIDTENFFYGKSKLKNSRTLSAPQGQFADNLTEKLQPQYIQPRSRYSSFKLSGSIIDAKKENDDLGLPSLKMSRSATKLTSLTALGPSGGSNAGSARARASISRQFHGLTLTSNSSTSSLVIAEEIEDTIPLDHKDWENNYNDLIYGRSEHNTTKLAPFGGFSNPDLQHNFFNQDNIFETAPWNIQFADKGNLSLTKAVKLSQEAGVINKTTWVGTLAMPSDAVPESVIANIGKALSDEYNCEAVFPNDITFQGHYKSFCKQILWPTFHYQIPDDPKSKAFEDHSWSHYKVLNQLVADKIVETYKRENESNDPNDPENMIWIHDYHLLLVPLMVREKLPDAKIGLFLHISFPSSEVFRCFAQRNQILQGMLGANCISFQTEEYVRHFLQTCSRLLLADANEYGISYEGNLTMVNTSPVGIDAKSLTTTVQSDEVAEWRQLIRDRWSDQHLIVSRDKLDRLRGIKQKLLAYETFLIDNPKYIDNTVLIQICINSSHDPEYESEIAQIVARINSLPENISVSQPVVLLQRDIEFDQYLALQCEADVFVVSSMREGLNLTCHEFITATRDRKSPLILSEFTGSAPLLDCHGKGAVLINPWDHRKFSEAFKQSLTMSDEEKQLRWKNCFDFVITRDSKHWVSSCLQSINEAWERDQRKNTSSLPVFTRSLFRSFYKDGKSGKRVFFINLETPFALSNVGNINATSAGKNSYSEPGRISNLLSSLLENPNNFLYLISFMKRRDLDNVYGRYPNIGLIAENGAYIKLIRSNKWVSTIDDDELQLWMSQVIELALAKAERLPGSFVTIGDCTVIFHAGKSFLDNHERSVDAMGDFIQHVNDVFEGTEQEIHATLVRDAVVVQQSQVSLEALKFIIAYYNQNKSPEEFESLLEDYKSKSRSLLPGSEPSSPVQEIKRESLPVVSSPNADTKSSTVNSQGVSSIFFSGGSTAVDEPLYEYVNNLKEVGEVENTATVTALGVDADARTAANYSVRGKNQLLGILSYVG